MPREGANTRRLSDVRLRASDAPHKVQIAQILVKGAYVPLITPLAVAGLMIWVLRHSVPSPHLAVWGGLIVAVYGFRYALFRKPASYLVIWKFPFLPLFAFLAFLSGALWGSAGILFFDPQQFQYQALLAFCLGGLVAGSLASYASWPMAFFAFSIPALLPLSVQLIRQNDEVQVVMGLILLLFGAALCLLARIINRSFLQSMDLQSALGHSEGRFRGVFESSPAGMMLMDLDGEILMVNRSFGQLLGYRPEELFGRNWRDISHPDEIAPIELLDQKLISGDLANLLVEKRFLHKDGRAIWTDIATSLIEHPHQGKASLLRQVFDITDLKSVERMKNEFVSTVSHELRTPLTSIEGSLGLILGGAAGEISESAREMTVLASKNSRRLINLVNDLLDLDRMESNDLPLSFELVDVNELILDTIEQNRGLLNEVGVTLLYAAVDEKVCVIGDRGRLGQVLTNLISNAVKFSPESGDVDITLKRQGAQLRITVIDQGAGVPDSFRASIFDRFSQADASDTRTKSGAGLGLSISKSIIEKHAGNLDFQSQSGKGASFYFELQEWSSSEPVTDAIEKLRANGLRPGR